MAIFRVHKDTNFTIISNDLIRDKRLSLKARGLMILMLSLPDDWDFSIAGLASINQESTKTIKTMLSELKAYGYLVVNKKMPNETESKKIEYVYDLYEIPREQKQGTQNQPLDNQPLENSLQLNKEKQSKDKQSTSKENTKRKFDPVAFLDTVDAIRDNEELKTAFIGFIEMRKASRKPINTEQGMKLLINSAWKCGHGSITEIIAVVNKATECNWQGFWEIKENNKPMPVTRAVTSNPTYNNTMAILDAMYNEALAEEQAKEAAT